MTSVNGFDRFASRNFYRQCVFSGAIGDGLARCANALKQNTKPYADAPCADVPCADVDERDDEQAHECRYHCLSSQDQINCVSAVAAALSASRFALGSVVKPSVQARHLQHRFVELGLLQAMRDSVSPGLHPNVPVANVTRLVNHVLGPCHGEIPTSIQTQMIRRVSQQMRDTPK